jgi:hypothetical protein
MNAPRPGAFPPAPAEPFEPGGAPRFGAYEGTFAAVDPSRRHTPGPLSRLRRAATEKRWQYGVVATNDVLAAFAVVDLGYASNAFVFAVDLANGGLLSDASFLGVPGLSAHVGDAPWDGLDASFGAGGGRFRVLRPSGAPRTRVDVGAGNLSLDALLGNGDAPGLSAVLAANGGDFDVTAKHALLPALGTLSVGDRSFDLHGGFGGLDYTSGRLARRTAWRWAFATGRTDEGVPVAFNLTDGLSDQAANEFALWIGNRLVPASVPRFQFDPENPEGHWAVKTVDGEIDVTFASRGMHREDRNLGLVRSHFVQVAGLFSGTVRDPDGRVHRLVRVPGVTEDQDVTW